MKLATTIPDLRLARARLASPVGFVPTMGYLHAGHISLVHRARQECASVVVSIFVNPTQFSPHEDLASYPRDLQRDQKMLEDAKVDLLWTPSEEQMYPVGFQTWVTVENVTQPLEGSMRPNHFRGVATVVTKLFNAVQPQKAFFGQKDAQQAVVIRQMTKDLNFPVEIVILPTVREPDGLAMSSRNTYLNPEERRASAVIFKSLTAGREAYLEGERNAEKIRLIVKQVLADEPLARPQYISCANLETLQELEWISHGGLLSMAVFIGKIRLIDNILLP